MKSLIMHLHWWFVMFTKIRRHHDIFLLRILCVRSVSTSKRSIFNLSVCQDSKENIRLFEWVFVTYGSESSLCLRKIITDTDRALNVNHLKLDHLLTNQSSWVFLRRRDVRWLWIHISKSSEIWPLRILQKLTFVQSAHYTLQFVYFSRVSF